MSDSKKAAPAMAKPGQSRRTLLMIAGPVFLLLVAAVWWITGGRYEETDNAYLHLGRVTVAADVGGRVVSVMVADNQAVKAGDTLFEVDPTPYKLALAKGLLTREALEEILKPERLTRPRKFVPLR